VAVLYSAQENKYYIVY